MGSDVDDLVFVELGIAVAYKKEIVIHIHAHDPMRANRLFCHPRIAVVHDIDAIFAHHTPDVRWIETTVYGATPSDASYANVFDDL